MVGGDNFIHFAYLVSSEATKGKVQKFVTAAPVLPAAKPRASDGSLADTMIGRAVEHMFETEEGPKEEWRGMVLARAPIITTWFYITYEKDPVLYMYQLLEDYKEGDLRIMPDSSEFTKLLLHSLRWRFREEGPSSVLSIWIISE